MTDSKTTKETHPPHHKDSKKAPTQSAQIAAFVKERPLIPALLILALFGLVFLGMQAYTWYAVATVNSEPISRFAFIEELETAAGQQVLDGLVTQTLIRQRADQEGVTVSDEELNARLEELAAQFGQGQSLDELLEMQGLERSDIEDQIRLEMQLEKLAIDGEVQVATEEIDAFIEQNDQLAAEDADLEQLRQTAEEQIANQKRGQQIQQYLQQLRDESEVTINLGE